MNRVREHHRATLRHIADLQQSLDYAIRRARRLADEAPESDDFEQTLAGIHTLDERIRAARKLARSLNAMLPNPSVRLVPPTPQRFPTPRPHRARPWARVVQMTARPARCFKTPT